MGIAWLAIHQNAVVSVGADPCVRPPARKKGRYSVYLAPVIWADNRVFGPRDLGRQPVYFAPVIWADNPCISPP
jgi:hypothetical protein